MKKARKDDKGRALKQGEYQRYDRSYEYRYKDPFNKRKCIYAPTLMELREQEKELMRDQLDGLDVYAKGMAT
ncbi:MAG: integrase DNA-binding domain-containing protein [Lachnospiraceae bacterium]|nr:integrase DNA-binding domain-containing protein [Lachnospiraceae bacterium]